MRDPPDYVVTDGGDGTLHWVLNEAKKHVSSVADVPPLLPTNGGTIDFVARKVGVKGNAESIVRELVKKLDRGSRPNIVEIDSLILEGTELDAEGALVDFSRLGFALAAGGIGQRFLDHSERELGRGAIVRVVAKAVASRIAGQLRLPLPDRLLDYGRDVFAPTHAHVTIDGEEIPGENHGAIHAGIHRRFAGWCVQGFPPGEGSAVGSISRRRDCPERDYSCVAGLARRSHPERASQGSRRGRDADRSHRRRTTGPRSSMARRSSGCAS